MFSFLGLAEKLGKPRWIVWENVPGCLSSGEPKGSDFGCLIQGLVELGYGVSWRILDAQHFGVPQRRRRVFVVACLGDWRAAAEVLSLREGLRGYLETGNKKRKGPAADAGAGVEAGCQGVAFRKSKIACSTTDNETWVPADARNTLNNFDLGDTRTPHVAIPPMAVRRLTPNECYRLQGFPDNWGNIPWKGKPEGQAPDGPQYKAAGNSMAVPVMRWIGERIAAVNATLSQNHETK